jgi:O-succinylbenzoate synthase
MERFDMEYDLISLGLNDNKIDGLVNNVNLERLSNHPVKLDANQLKEIFDLIPKKN